VFVTDSTISSNLRVGAGGGLGVFILENSNDPPPAQIVLTGSTIASNGATGPSGRGGGVYAETGELRIDNSTLTGNAADVSGGAAYTASGDIFLRHATVYGNFGPTGADLATAEDLHAFASVVALGTPSAAECAIAGTTTSTGYNVGGDGSCAFVGGPGDLNTTPDAGLGPLLANGGPTRTLMPTAASPLNGRVPAAACTVLTVDQRGVARPQGVACETGAVEIVEVAPAPPCTRTGTPGNDVLVGTGGIDVLCGLGGNDTLLGLGGNDELRGGDGNDLLVGGAGNDTMHGGAGTDVLIGAPGIDVYDGGPGTDLCVRPGGPLAC
jgi:Ca2+-binding RTX toxin-like protein